MEYNYAKTTYAGLDYVLIKGNTLQDYLNNKLSFELSFNTNVIVYIATDQNGLPTYTGTEAHIWLLPNLIDGKQWLSTLNWASRVF